MDIGIAKIILFITLLLNGCGSFATKFAATTDVPISKITTEKQVDFYSDAKAIPVPYAIKGSLFVEMRPYSGGGALEPQELRVKLHELARSIGADAVLDYHQHTYNYIQEARDYLRNFYGSASALWLKYVDADEASAIYKRTIDLMPVENLHLFDRHEKPIWRERIRYLVQYFLEKNGYYVKFIDSNKYTNIKTAGNKDSPLLMTLKFSEVEGKVPSQHDDDEMEPSKKIFSVLRATIYDKKSGDIIWTGEGIDKGPNVGLPAYFFYLTHKDSLYRHLDAMFSTLPDETTSFLEEKSN